MVMINDIEQETEPWLIEGMVCPWLTLLSGQPKHGKTILAGHIATSLINNQPLLGKNVKPGEHRIAWMGYDGGWKDEIVSRLKSKANNKIAAYAPIRTIDENLWREFAERLKNDGNTLFILDHLYGMAGTIGLNDANNFAILANLLRPIYEEYRIPVLVLAQAGKGEFSNGRAAHSVALEGEARCLLRLYEKRSHGYRKLDISSNTNGEEKLAIRLTPELVEYKESKDKLTREVTDRDSFEPVRNLLESTKLYGEITSWADAGRRLTSLGYSRNHNAGRSMANRYREQGLLKKDAGIIVKGDSFLSMNA
jgi:hypothetical protein